MKPIEDQSLVERLRTRASIRRNIKDRKSVQEGKPDRIADLLEEAADRIEGYNEHIQIQDLHREYQNRTIERLAEYNRQLIQKETWRRNLTQRY